MNPSVYHATPVNVPTGAGELWAQVGRTAMDASTQIQNSALNPAVREGMKYAVANYKRNEGYINFLNSLPGNMGYLLGQSGLAPGQITDPTMATRFLEAMGALPGADSDTRKKAPEVNPSTAPPEAPTGKESAKPTGTPPPTTGQMHSSAGSAVSLPTTDLAASTDNDFLLRRMMQEREASGSSAAQPGTPSSMTFLNPATGNVEPLQTGPSATAQPPPAPTAPTPSMTPSPQEMANWQERTAHPVMSSSDAVKWAKGFDTRAQDATYLPKGGPGGSPAFAIHMKGGGVNTVPVSQIAQTSGGAASITGQNTSTALSVANQPQPAPPQQPYPTIASDQGGLQLPPGQPGPGQPPIPMAPPGQPNWSQGPGAAIVGATPSLVGAQPPPAPGMTDIYGNPLSAYTSVASRGGQTPDQLTAGAEPGGQPAQPPERPLWETVPQADRDTATANAAKMGNPTGPYTGDRKVEGTTGPYTYYRQDDPKQPYYGRVYTTLPGPAGHYFNQKRWFLGTNQYEDYELPDSAAKQQMWDKWGAAGYLTRSYIDGMDEKAMEPWLQRSWENEHLVNKPIDEDTNLTLDTSEQLDKNFRQIGDILQTLANHKYPRIDSMDKITAATENAATALGAPPNKAADSIRKLEELVDQTQGFLQGKGLLQVPGHAEGIKLQDLKVIPGTDIPLPSIPGSTELSDIAFGGQDIKDKLRKLNAMRTVNADRYNRLVAGQHTMLQRVYPAHDANSLKALQNIPLEDNGNLYAGHNYPGEPPIVSADEYPKWAKDHPGAAFITTGGQPMQVPK